MAGSMYGSGTSTQYLSSQLSVTGHTCPYMAWLSAVPVYKDYSDVYTKQRQGDKTQGTSLLRNPALLHNTTNLQADPSPWQKDSIKIGQTVSISKRSSVATDRPYTGHGQLHCSRANVLAWVPDCFQGLHRPAPQLQGQHAPKEIIPQTPHQFGPRLRMLANSVMGLTSRLLPEGLQGGPDNALR
ncbi:hypothetical protein Bbelb_167520 [Branchiostoma belcheri]|nr:hypothetical protein Bbelb_167520 [Branchiostoma belcheri]